MTPGDQALLHADVPEPRLSAKLFQKWKEPYEVRQVLSDALCSINAADDPTERRFTVQSNRLKPDYIRSNDPRYVKWL